MATSNIYNSANTTTQIADERLWVEKPAIREMKRNGKIELNWIAKDKHIADCLTKGAACTNIMSVLQNGMLRH